MNSFKLVNSRNEQRLHRQFYITDSTGKVTKITREVYLRNDVNCGIEKCGNCENQKKKLLDGDRDILIVDIDTLIRHIDFFYDCPVDNVLILLSIYERIKTYNKIIYNKLSGLCYNTGEGEVCSNKRYCVFINKYCKFTHVEGKECELKEVQEIIRVVIWMKNHNPYVNLVVLTSNEILRKDCESNEVRCFTLYEYVQQQRQQIPRVLHMDDDKIKAYFEDFVNVENRKGVDSTKQSLYEYESAEEEFSFGKNLLYKPYLSKVEMVRKLREGSIRKGTFNVVCVNKVGKVIIGNDQEIIILGSGHMNRAIHNDIVAVELLNPEEEEELLEEGMEDDYFDEVETSDDEEDVEPEIKNLEEQESGNFESFRNFKEKEKKKYGKVVGIINRNRVEYGGMIKPYEDEKNVNQRKLRFFKAFNNKIPFIIIQNTLMEDLYNKRVIVVIDSWEAHSKYPLGRCIKVIGKCDDIETETQLIYHEYDINTNDFNESVYKCLPPEDFTIPKEEYEKRIDFRDKLTFSIDPPGCKDIDDALSVEVLEKEKLYKIGVHIADVTYFVKQNSALDIEASKRCTSVYLINQRTDMLPKLLTTNLCSLVPNEERLTFSCIFTFAQDTFEIVDIQVSKCIIKSCKAFYYEEAQRTIDDQNNQSEIAKALRILNKIAKHLRKQWIDQGALELKSSSEILFEFENNEFSKTKNMKPYVSYETNKLIEIFMLLSNKSIGKIIFQKFKSSCILRRHPPPKEKELLELKAYLESIQIYDFKFGSSKELSESLERLGTIRDENLSTILKMLTTKCMNEALYITGSNVHDQEMLRHYGLGADVYTFFTSPIRRYADIMVHRVLNHIYKIEPLQSKYTDVTYLNKQIDQLNEKNRNARFASRASVDFFCYLYFKKIGNQVTQAVITSLKKNGIQVYVPLYSIEGTCYLKRKNGFLYQESKKQFKKIDEETHKPFYLKFYDTVEIYIHVDSTTVKCQNQFTFIRKL